MRKCLETNENEYITYQNLEGATKAVLRGECIVVMLPLKGISNPKMDKDIYKFTLVKYDLVAFGLFTKLAISHQDLEKGKNYIQSWRKRKKIIKNRAEISKGKNNKINKT